MKAIIPWIAQIGLIAAMYGAFVLDIDGARALITFYAWAVAVILLFMVATTPEIAATLPDRPTLRIVDGCTMVALLIALAWNRQFLTASIWLLGIMSAVTLREKAREVWGRAANEL